MKFTIGDVVQLKSGGQKMTITGEVKGLVLCVWMDSNNRIQKMAIVEQALILTEPVKSDVKVEEPLKAVFDPFKIGARFYHKGLRKECIIAETPTESYVKCKFGSGEVVRCSKTSLTKAGLTDVPSKKVETKQPDPYIIDINDVYIGQHLQFKQDEIDCIVTGKDLAANKLIVKTNRYGATTETPSDLKLDSRFPVLKVGDKVKAINGLYCTIDAISPSGAIICGWLGLGPDRHTQTFTGYQLTKI